MMISNNKKSPSFKGLLPPPFKTALQLLHEEQLLKDSERKNSGDAV
jgi:hypothetical protein